MHIDTNYIYGKNPIRELLLARPDLVKTVHLAADFGDATLLELLKEKKVARGAFDPKHLPSGVPSDAVHQGILAQVELGKLLQPYDAFIERCSITPDTAFIVLGELEDPQNVGSIIRSAAAFGVAGILIPEHRQTQLSGSVIKVSAGMAFRIPLVRIGNVNTTIDDLKSRGFWVYGLADEGETPLFSEGFEKASVFVIGNEGEGIREKTLEHCDIKLSIPMSARAESLNAAVATAVALSRWSEKHPRALT